MSQASPSATPELAEVFARIQRAAALDDRVYAEVRDDPGQTIPGLVIAAIVILLGAIGGWLWLSFEFDGLDTGRILLREVLLGSLLGVALWALWVVIARALLQRNTEVSDLAATFRCMGYAAVPGALAFLVLVPTLSLGIGILALAAWFASSDLALRAVAPAASGRALTVANAAGFAAFATILALLGHQAGMAPGPFVHAGGIEEYVDTSGFGGFGGIDFDSPGLGSLLGDVDDDDRGGGLFGDGSGGLLGADPRAVEVITGISDGGTVVADFQVADMRAGDGFDPVRADIAGREREGVRLGDLLALANVDDWQQVSVSGTDGLALIVFRADVEADPDSFLLYWSNDEDATDTVTFDDPVSGRSTVDVYRVTVLDLDTTAGGSDGGGVSSGDIDEVVSQYSDLMRDLGDALERIDSVGDAESARDDLLRLFADFDTISGQLAATNPQALANALTDGDSELLERLAKVSEQLARIVQDPEIAAELGPFLGGPPVFTP